MVDTVVERCAECNGGLRIVLTDSGVAAVREAARQRRYLAEPVLNLSGVDPNERGHRVSCSEWKAKDT